MFFLTGSNITASNFNTWQMNLNLSGMINNIFYPFFLQAKKKNILILKENELY
jgi:hypothetical protein